MIIEKEYQYRPGWLLIILCGSFFGAGAAILTRMAWTNDRGLILNGIIELEEFGASVFYWILAACSYAFVLAALFLIFHRLKFNQRIAVTDTGLIVPRSRFSSDEMTIDYSEIVQTEYFVASGEAFLNIFHSGGKFVVTARMMPSKADFEELTQIINTKTTT